VTYSETFGGTRFEILNTDNVNHLNNHIVQLPEAYKENGWKILSYNYDLAKRPGAIYLAEDDTPGADGAFFWLKLTQEAFENGPDGSSRWIHRLYLGIENAYTSNAKKIADELDKHFGNSTQVERIYYENADEEDNWGYVRDGWFQSPWIWYQLTFAHNGGYIIIDVDDDYGPQIGEKHSDAAPFMLFLGGDSKEFLSNFCPDSDVTISSRHPFEQRQKNRKASRFHPEQWSRSEVSLFASEKSSTEEKEVDETEVEAEVNYDKADILAAQWTSKYTQYKNYETSRFFTNVLKKKWGASILQTPSFEFFKVFGKVGDKGSQIEKINRFLVDVWGYDYTAMITSHSEYSVSTGKAVINLKNYINREYPYLSNATSLAFSCEICHPPCQGCNSTNCNACDSPSSLFNSQTYFCGHFTRALISCLDILPDNRQQSAQTLEEMKLNPDGWDHTPFISITGATYNNDVMHSTMVQGEPELMEFWIRKNWAASLQIAHHQPPTTATDFTIEAYEIIYGGNDKISQIKIYEHNLPNGSSPHQIVQLNAANIDVELRNREKFMCGHRDFLPKNVQIALKNPQINDNYNTFDSDSDSLGYCYLFIEMEQVTPNDGPTLLNSIPKKNILWRLGYSQPIQVTLYDYHGPKDNGFGRKYGLNRPPGFGMKISSGDLASKMGEWTDSLKAGGVKADINGQITFSAGLGILILWIIDISIQAFLRIDVKGSLRTDLDSPSEGSWFLDIGWQIRASGLGSDLRLQDYHHYSISRQNDLNLAYKQYLHVKGDDAVFPLSAIERQRLGDIYRKRKRIEMKIGKSLRVRAEFDMPDPMGVISYSEYKSKLLCEYNLDTNSVGPYIRFDGQILGSPWDPHNLADTNNTNPDYKLSSYRLRLGVSMYGGIPKLTSNHMINTREIWPSNYAFYSPAKGTNPKTWLKPLKMSVASEYYVQLGIQLQQKFATPKPLLDTNGNLVSFSGTTILNNPLGFSTSDEASILTYLNNYVLAQTQPSLTGIGAFARLGGEMDITIPILSWPGLAVTIKGGISAYIDLAAMLYLEEYSNALPSNVNAINALFDLWADPNTTYDVKKLGFPKPSEIGPG